MSKGASAGAEPLFGKAGDTRRWMAEVNDSLAGRGLGAFASRADKNPGVGHSVEERAALTEAYTAQIQAAVMSLRMKKFPKSELRMDNADSIALVEAERAQLDAQAALLVLKDLTAKQKDYLLDLQPPPKLAAERFIAMQGYFGGGPGTKNVPQQRLHRIDMFDCVYVPGLEGSGARALHSDMVAHRRGIQDNGGSYDDDTLMSDIVDKFKLMEGGLNQYAVLTLNWEARLSTTPPTLSLTQLRVEMERAEKKQVKQGNRALPAASGGPAIGTAQVTSDPDLVAMIAQAVGVAMATVNVGKNSGGGGGGGGAARGGGRKPKKPRDQTKDSNGDFHCFQFQDKGECRFGDDCRFSHLE